ncbi:MAG: DUF4389 domain-containing protein [Phycisphaeraceae bacterium]
MEAGIPPAAPPVAPAATGQYPIRFDVDYKDKLSRLTTLLRLILVIPQIIVLYVLFIIAEICVLIAWFAIVITGKMPRGLFDLIVNVNRWSANVNAYMWLLRDEYPPFTWDPGNYPVRYEADYEEKRSRLTTLLRLILVIPQMIVLCFVILVAEILAIIAWFAILFTGRFPEGMFGFVRGALRWQFRVNGYFLLLTDRYPPFSLD